MDIISKVGSERDGCIDLDNLQIHLGRTLTVPVWERHNRDRAGGRLLRTPGTQSVNGVRRLSRDDKLFGWETCRVLSNMFGFVSQNGDTIRYHPKQAKHGILVMVMVMVMVI